VWIITICLTKIWLPYDLNKIWWRHKFPAPTQR
jgi:hypothetical protein